VRVRLIDQGPSIAPQFGSRARAVIEQALRSLAVEVQTGVRVSGPDADGGSTRARGIDDGLLVWAAGPRASPINGWLGVELDALGRVPVDAHLATGIDGVWAAGDSARVLVDGSHLALMSCQHAMPQGRQAGANAAAATLGRPLGHYRQPLYLTCLDLGSAGAVLTSGFAQDTVLATGPTAKRFKRFINRSLIYPPADMSVEQALKLGTAAPPGPLGAAAQRLALRSHILRDAVSARAEDHAAQYLARESSR
jgi:NADH dehydrogenase